MRAKVDECNRILAGRNSIETFGRGRVDPSVPIEATVATLTDLVKGGKIGGIQLPEVRADTIRWASKVARIDWSKRRCLSGT